MKSGKLVIKAVHGTYLAFTNSQKTYYRYKKKKVTYNNIKKLRF